MAHNSGSMLSKTNWKVRNLYSISFKICFVMRIYFKTRLKWLTIAEQLLSKSNWKMEICSFKATKNMTRIHFQNYIWNTFGFGVKKEKERQDGKIFLFQSYVIWWMLFAEIEARKSSLESKVFFAYFTFNFSTEEFHVPSIQALTKKQFDEQRRKEEILFHLKNKEVIASTLAAQSFQLT